ncbi:hypothetical protein C4588_07680 [Candidatus Parcubacteria bacterium]|nr:MAG: hypothetical protein C4588_07680 [Candidatus Parcubacteria bacterium]
MIIKNRGLICKKQVSKRPKSSIPQKETSVHLNLQVLYSKKNMLESNIRIWESKLESIHYELQKVKEEIVELEAFAKSILNNNAEEAKCSISSNSLDLSIESDVKIIDLEY